MTAFDLMVGNYVYKEGKIEELFSVYIGDIVQIGGKNYDIRDIKPIEITSDILEKFGFEKDMNFPNEWRNIEIYTYYTYTMPFIKILHNLNNNKFWIMSESEKLEVRYFHEIQNYVNIIKKVGFNLFTLKSE